MKLSMQEVAKEAGVSAATVSRIINGNGIVASDKREKVLQIITREAGKNRSVDQRKKRRARHIGLLFLSGSEFDFRTLGIKVLNIANHLPQGYDFHIYSPSFNAHQVESNFLRGELDGLFLIGHNAEDRFFTFLLNRIPHVWLNSHQLEGEKAVSLMGNEFAGKIAANYLIEHNCKRPAVLSFQTLHIGLLDRISGFEVNCFIHKRQARKIELDLAKEKSYSDPIPGEGADIETKIKKALDLIPPKEFPDGIFSPEEALTPYLYRVFQQKKIRKYPRVISCNYTPGYLRGLYPRPASIDLHPETQVKLAIDELINRIEGKNPRPDNVASFIQPELIPGED